MRSFLITVIAALLGRSPAFAVILGYDTLGASEDNTNLYANANAFTATANGGAQTATACYGGSMDSGTGPVYVGLYDFGDGNISANNRLAVSSVITLTTTAQFVCANISIPAITNGVTYFIEAYSNTDFVNTRYTIGVTDQFTNTTGGAASPPDPHITREGTQDARISVYISYAASGGVVCPSRSMLGVGCGL